MLERPPILQGNTGEQVRVLHDYLVRLASTLDGSIQAATALSKVNVSVDKQGRTVLKTGDDTVGSRTAAEIRKSADELRALIIKSADDVYEYMDSKEEEYNGRYVAQSEYGSFVQETQTRINSTAMGVQENYSLIEELQSSNGVMQQYLTDLNGQIRRGIVWDPSINDYVVGIAISQKISFTSQTPATVDGKEYYYISDKQTFGLYASTGWQFWLDGQKVGWFDSVTGELHVNNITVENRLTVGNAIFDMTTRFDIRPRGDGQ